MTEDQGQTCILIVDDDPRMCRLLSEFWARRGYVTVSVDQMIDTVAESRVIYVGETHDNIEAHRAQLEVIRQLSERFPRRPYLPSR